MSRWCSVPIMLASSALLAVPATAGIVISEIHYHPVEEPGFNPDGTPAIDLTDDVHEFLEIQNTAAAPVDLEGWLLAGAVEFIFPVGTSIPAGGFKVIARDVARLETVYGISGVLGPYSGKLGNSGDTLRLKDAAGATVDSVAYSSDFPWAMSANALGAQDRFTSLNSASYQYKGRSLQRVSATASSNDPANWLASPLLSGPTPGTAQAVTRSVPKPVVIAQSRFQGSDGAPTIRGGQTVAVNATFSSIHTLSSVQVEYFVDNMNSTAETRALVGMAPLGNGIFTAVLPGQPDRSIVRYRFTADLGEGIESVSPRADDPALAPVGAGGSLEAWHGYFVTPARASSAPVYDVLVSTTNLSTMGTNIGQNPKRVTSGNANGQPREVPYVAATAPRWNGTVPAVLATDGFLYDIHLRYHGSRYHRATSNKSFKLHYPETQPLNRQTAWFVTGHGTEFAEATRLNRLLGLPASKTRTVSWYFNNDAVLSRLEQGEYAGEMLEEFHDLRQQLDPGAAKEKAGELYKVQGNLDASQGNTEGPFCRGDQAPLAANSGWTQLQRYEWTFSLQNHAWKGPKPIRDLIEGMWPVRGDSPASTSLAGNPTRLANTKAWMNTNFDMDTTLTSLALLQWMGIWDDTAHNQFFWRRASGKWVRLGWDYDQVMASSRIAQSIYAAEAGVNVFGGTSWWKDTFFKCFRGEFKQRLWELNNSFLDPANLTALGLPTAAGFAASRQANVNAELALGSFAKPARPTNAAPATGSAVLGGASLATSAYSHPAGKAHAKTKWEIRSISGTYEEPVTLLTSSTSLVSLPMPFDQLLYGHTYFWRATYVDADGHSSIVSAESSFTWGTAVATPGTLVLNEILADNLAAAENAGVHPDYVELRNTGTSTYALGGLSLTDDPQTPAKYSFPAGTTLAVGAYLVVWCDSDPAAPGLHTGFGLSANGQTLLLLDGNTILDSVTFGPQAPDLPIGRIGNGALGWQACTATPGAVNTARTLGPTSALRFNEWMAAPVYGDDWFEICNWDDNPVALGGLSLSDDPAAPTTTKIPALSFIAGKGFTSFVADGSAAGGHHVNFKLGGGGDSLVLTAPSGTDTLDLVTFGPQTPDVSQGRLPDGGATVVAFAGSTSAARSNWLEVPVVINEALTNSTAPLEDSVEIFNPTDTAVSLAGWWLSDDRSAPEKYQIPPGTTVPAGGFVVISESQFNTGTSPFSLSATGDEIVLSAVDGLGALTGYRAQVSFGPAAEDVSFGRVGVAGGVEFWPQTARTPGAVNGLPKTTPIIINEAMYHPADYADGSDNAADEFIELHNPSATVVDLAGWRLKGGADFTFPADAFIPAAGYLLLVGFDPANAATLAAFRTAHGLAESTPVHGPYAPKLSNAAQNLELAVPMIFGATPEYVLVDKLEYRDLAPWPVEADGTGRSLQRLSRSLIGNDAANWAAALPTPGAANAGVITELTIVTDSPLPGGAIGSTYTAVLTAVGGTTPYTWSVSAGAPPDGLTLTSEGVLNGLPATAGTFSFTLLVTDGVNATTATPSALTVATTPLAIATASPLTDGTYGASYAQSFAATGGTAPYAWSVSAGALPAGLTLNSAGLLSGTPTRPGAFGFTTRVTDAGGLATTKALALTVPAPPLTITTGSALPAAALTGAYAQALQAVGGVAPYTWTVSSGALPPGLSLTSAGDLGGTPTAAGTFAFIALATDSLGTSATREFTLFVTPAPLLITTVSPLPDGIVGTVYSRTLVATGGTSPHAWSVSKGALPEGLTLSGAGVLSGTPTTEGTFSFAVRVEDAAHVATTVSMSVTMAMHGPLDHFTWDYAPVSATAGAPFVVRLTARDAAGRLVTAFNGNVDFSAATTGTAASPLFITEVTDEAEDQIELQNVTAAPADTSGWFVRINDTAANINAINAITLGLPASVAAGGLLRISESNTVGRTYWGSAINWSSSGISKGWIMLCDATSTPRDFFAFGWTPAELASLNLSLNGKTITAAGNWDGAPAAVGTRGTTGNTTDSWSRRGTADHDSAADWTFSTNGQTFAATNPGLLLPWSTTVPVASSPDGVTLVGGEFLGFLTIAQAAENVSLTADDGAGHTGLSTAFTVAAALADTDDDSLPDAWEIANGLTVGTDDADGDADGDGSTNRTEFLVGTDPRSAASRFRIRSLTVPGTAELDIVWDAVAGKIYHLASSPDAQTWSTVEGSVVLALTDGPLTLRLSTGGGPQLYIRAEVASVP